MAKAIPKKKHHQVNAVLPDVFDSTFFKLHRPLIKKFVASRRAMLSNAEFI